MQDNQQHLAVPDVLFVCSKHDEDPAAYEDCMACGTLACLEHLWRSCEVTLDIGAVRQRLRAFDGEDGPQ